LGKENLGAYRINPLARKMRFPTKERKPFGENYWGAKTGGGRPTLQWGKKPGEGGGFRLRRENRRKLNAKAERSLAGGGRLKAKITNGPSMGRGRLCQT